MTRSRVAGAMRLVAFVAVLALIVGTSVGLASADERGAAKTAAPVSTSSTSADTDAVQESVTALARETTSKGDVAGDDAAADDAPAAAAAEEPAADAVSVDPTATAGTASGEVPQSRLPLTGDVQVRWLLLGGAVLVLVGMLVQVAGQPLPARARARR